MGASLLLALICVCAFSPLPILKAQETTGDPVPNVEATAVGLTATPISPTRIDVSWDGVGGTLYCSTDPNFTPIYDGDEDNPSNNVYTTESTNNSGVNAFHHTGLLPNTTYYYILVPTFGTDYTPGHTNAKTRTTYRRWHAAPALTGSLKSQRTSPAPEAANPDPAAPPTSFPPLQPGQRVYPPGTVVTVSAASIVDNDTCENCGPLEDIEQPVADTLTYQWTGGDAPQDGGDGTGADGAGAEEGASNVDPTTTVTMPTQLGATVMVTCAIDDTPTPLILAPGGAPGETGDRDDSPLTKTLTFIVRAADPNHPDLNGNGIPDDEEGGQTTTPPGGGITGGGMQPPIALPGQSLLYWRVLHNNAQELSNGSALSLGGTVGGTVAIQVIVKVARKGRVAPETNNVTLRVQETGSDNDVTHPFGQNHAEFVLDLADPHWDFWTAQQVMGGNAPVPQLIRTGQDSAKAENVSDDLDYFYTKTIVWNTTSSLTTDLDATGLRPASTLLGHNGEHKISVAEVNSEAGSSVLFQKKDSDGTEWQNAPFNVQETTHIVGNLVIKNVSTSNGTEDYFKFDRESTENSLTQPKVTFEIEDKGEKNRYEWYLWVKPTRGEYNSVAISGILDQPGVKTVTINASESEQNANGYSQEHPLTEWGPYTFDLRVKEIKTDSLAGIGEPLVDFRSDKLQIPFTYTQQDGGEVLSGHDLNWDEATGRWTASYYIDSERDASAMSIDLVNVELETVASVSTGKQKKNRYEDVFLYQDQADDPDGENRAIFMAIDSFADEYRDHKNRHARAVNKDDRNTLHLQFQSDRMGVTDGNPALFKLVDSSKAETHQLFEQNNARIGRAFRLGTNGAPIDSIATLFRMTSPTQVGLLERLVQSPIQWTVTGSGTVGSGSGPATAKVFTPNVYTRAPEYYVLTAKHMGSGKTLIATIYACDIPGPDRDTWMRDNDAYDDTIFYGSATMGYGAAVEARDWAHGAGGEAAFPSQQFEDTSRNAAEHALWNALSIQFLLTKDYGNSNLTMTQAISLTRGATYAHEWTNMQQSIDSHLIPASLAQTKMPKDNASAMDIFNNFRGQQIYGELYSPGLFSSSPYPSVPTIRQKIVAEVHAGTLTRLDTASGSDATNPKGSGLLIKSQ